jgi:arylesterase
VSGYAKSGLTLLGVVVVVGFVFLLRYAMVDGFLDSISPVLPVCRVLAGGAEDLDMDGDRIFVSAADGVSSFKLNDPVPRKLAGNPPDLHSLGISLYRNIEGKRTLAAVARSAAGRYGVITYALSADDTPALSQQLMVQGGLLVSPTDLAAVAPDRFYMANDHVSTNGLMRFAESALLWPHADVLLFNGRGLRIAVQRVAAAHGLLATPDSRFLYAATYNDRRVLAFGIENFTGNLTELGSLALPARLEKITADASGNLIVAGRTKPGSAQIFRVYRGRDGVPLRYETLFSDEGQSASAANAAVLRGGHLIVAGEKKLLDCAVK